ncbi:MAG: EamA family transporter [Gammaproteobacteria bacterium]|nr:EamA family transporter [Gammaproteobacteria bacterium]
MPWFLLALLCAVSLASADVATKRWLRDYSARELLLVRFTLPGLLLSPLLLMQPFPDLPLEFWGWMALLLPLEIIALLLYMQAIRDYPLWLTLPYLAFTPVLVTFTGWLLLGEQVSMLGFAGICLVFAGTWVLNLETDDPGDRHPLLTPFSAILRNRGSRLMLLVAAIYSFTSVGGKAAMQYMPADLFGPFYFALLGAATLALFLLHKPATLRALYRRPSHNIMVALFMAVMVITHFLALEQIEAAYMIAVKRSSMLFGIVLGAILFREQGVAAHLAGGGLMVTGVTLIAVGSQ